MFEYLFRENWSCYGSDGIAAGDGQQVGDGQQGVIMISIQDVYEFGDYLY